MLNTLRKVFFLTEGSKRGRWVFVSLLAAANGALEALGAFLILALLALMADPGRVTEIPIVGGVRALFGDTSDRDLLLIFSGIVAIFFVIRAILFVAQTYIRTRIAHNAGVRLSVQLFERYLNMPYEQFVLRNSSDLIRNTLTAVADVVSNVFIPVTGLLSEFLLVLGVVAALVVAAPVPSAMATVILIPTMLILLKIVQPKMRSLGRTAQEMNASALKALQEGLGGVREIRLLGVLDVFRDRFAESRARLARTQYVRATYVETPRNAIETALILMIVLFLTVTVLRGDPTRETLAILGLFGYAGLRVLPAISRLIANVNSVRFGSAAVDDLAAELAVYPHVPARTDSVSFDNFDKLSVEKVTFKFGEGPDVLRGVDLDIHTGQTIGIAGETGCGKSTLIDIVLGLLTPISGQVLVDGVSIHEHQPVWHRQLGVVSQTVFLIDDTLRRNIAFGLSDDLIDEQRIEDVLRIAQLRDFVTHLDDGLDTVIGERGVRLSGGQRQRIAVARALYRKPRVLVLDEGTSALDSATEARLVDALYESDEIRLMLMIAHRTTSLIRCDRIFLLHEGRVVAAGTYDELSHGSELFRRMTVNPQPPDVVTDRA